jgi:hypothetical protein
MSSMIKITNAKVLIDPSATIICDGLPLPAQNNIWSGLMNADYSLVGNIFNFPNNINYFKSIIRPNLPGGGGAVNLTESRDATTGMGTLTLDPDFQNVTGYDTFDFTVNYGGHVFFDNWTSLEYIYLGKHSLESLYVTNCPALEYISSREEQSSEIIIVNCPSLTTILLANCTFLELGNCPLLKNVTIDGSSIPSYMVDSILQFIDENNTTNGAINITGSAGAPSAQGLVYKNNLVAKGFTVLHN